MNRIWKVSLVGAGKMGEAIIAGLLKSKRFSPKDIQVAEIADHRRRHRAVDL